MNEPLRGDGVVRLRLTAVRGVELRSGALPAVTSGLDRDAIADRWSVTRDSPYGCEAFLQTPGVTTLLEPSRPTKVAGKREAPPSAAAALTQPDVAAFRDTSRNVLGPLAGTPSPSSSAPCVRDRCDPARRTRLGARAARPRSALSSLPRPSPRHTSAFHEYFPASRCAKRNRSSFPPTRRSTCRPQSTPSSRCTATNQHATAGACSFASSPPGATRPSRTSPTGGKGSSST